MTVEAPDFMEWIEVIDNVPRLKANAPESVRHAYEVYQHAQDEEEPTPEENI